MPRPSVMRFGSKRVPGALFVNYWQTRYMRGPEFKVKGLKLSLKRVLYRLVFSAIAGLVLTFCVGVTPLFAAPAAKKETITYVVKKGDSVDKIAKHHEVRVEDIARWNNLADVARIRIGQKLRIRVASGSAVVQAKAGSRQTAPTITQNVYYVVKKGDNLGKISRKTGVSVEDLKKHNKGLRKNPDKLRVGQKLVLELKRFDGNSGVSRGLANNGSLSGGIILPPGPAYVVRNPKRSYGTALTVGTIMDAMDSYSRAFPKGPRFAVGDLSVANGGKLYPHVSHQSGRDVDISFIHKNGKEFIGFQRLNEKTFDAEKNWHLLEFLVKSGKVQYIFIDYGLQKVLYEHAKSKGYSDKELRGIIQYPNGKKSYQAIIRHAKGHADHLHARFVCAKTDVSCH